MDYAEIVVRFLPANSANITPSVEMELKDTSTSNRIAPVLVTGASVFVLGALVLQWINPLHSDADQENEPAIKQRSVTGIQSHATAQSFPTGQAASLSEDFLPLAETTRNTVDSGQSHNPRVHEISLAELDELHAAQTSDTLHAARNQMQEIRLPESDDSPSGMTLQELDQFHREQEAAIQRTAIEAQAVHLPAANGPSPSMTQHTLSQLHTEQAKQSFASNSVVKLPTSDQANDFGFLTATDLAERLEYQTRETAMKRTDLNLAVKLPPSADGPHALTHHDLDELHSRQERALERDRQAYVH